MARILTARNSKSAEGNRVGRQTRVPSPKPRDSASTPADIDDPWPIDGYPDTPPDCRCDPPSPHPLPPRSEPPGAKTKKDDCCRQILEVLRCIPGIDERCFRLRKPKAKPKVKIANLCGALPVKERLGPILLLILRRYRNGVKAANEFESNLQNFLTSLSNDRRAALEGALDAYDAMPASARDCVFETRFDDWPDDKPVDTGFIARNLVGEMLALGRMRRHNGGQEPVPSIGPVRPWTNLIPQPGEPGLFADVTAPWPWICAISPTGSRADTIEGWYRNESACVPGNVPRGSVNYFTHEFAWSCTATIDPKNPTAQMECRHLEPGASVGPGFGFAECPGGLDYRVSDKSIGRQVCLTIPLVDPGAEVGLRGLNFFSPHARIRIRKVDAPSFREIPLIPLSDWHPDTSTAAEKSTCEVNDHAYFILPDNVQDGLNRIPIPPGRYALQMVVPNDISFGIAGGGPPPKEFASNEILFDLEPSPNQRYQLFTDEAFCHEETDGLGADEPWFRAMWGVQEPLTADTKIPLPLLNPIEIMSTDDVDSGEGITFPAATLFNDAIGRRILAAAVIGLEVDSESAARKQIDNFWDAYGEYLSNFFVQLGSSTDAGALGNAVKESIKAGTISGWVWITGGILVAIFAAGFLYAVWAPADWIAIDSFTYTGRDLFSLTDGNLTNVRPGLDFLRVKELRMWSEPGMKVPVLGGSAIHTEKRHYQSTSEDSHYSLTYRLKRT